MLCMHGPHQVAHMSITRIFFPRYCSGENTVPSANFASNAGTSTPTPKGGLGATGLGIVIVFIVGVSVTDDPSGDAEAM